MKENVKWNNNGEMKAIDNEIIIIMRNNNNKWKSMK